MLFLLRLAFWIMVICLLLPGSREDNRRLIVSAERTVSDMRGFCYRNPDVCEDVRLSITAMLVRLTGDPIRSPLLRRQEAKRARRRPG
jgi:hypothetical protein